jgi:hypothetical protein
MAHVHQFDIVCITIDVDWSSSEVLTPILTALNERGLRATIFCTHKNIEALGHERAIHPNFRRSGDTMKNILVTQDLSLSYPDDYYYPLVIDHTLSFCPEAIGSRSHSLYYDSLLLSHLAQRGIQYDSSYLLPLTDGMHPVWKEYDILELPIYFNDHFELKSQATGFNSKYLHLDNGGLKILQFHPNMIYINAKDHDHYMESKPFYHDPESLSKLRFSGYGAGSFFLDILDIIVKKNLQCMTLSEVNNYWRPLHPFQRHILRETND